MWKACDGGVIILATRSGYLQHSGANLYYELDIPDLPEAARAETWVVVLHGGGEHGGRHKTLASYLAARGCHVLRPDWRGAGRSSGLRWHIHSCRQYLDDLSALLHDLHVPAPFYIVGQSVGGLLAAAYTLAYPQKIRALVVTSPFLGVKMPVPPWKASLAAILNVAAPTLRISTGLPVDMLAHERTVADEYRRDPLCYGKVSARWYSQIQRTQAEVRAGAPRIRVPAMVVQGGADVIADPEATQAFYNELGTTYKELLFYPDAYHEVLNEKWQAETRAWIWQFLRNF